MGPQPMGKVPDLRRLAGRVAPRSTVRWSWPWTFLGLCLLAAVVGGPAVDLLHAGVAAAAAGIRRSAPGAGQSLAGDHLRQPTGTTAGQQVSLTAPSVTVTSPTVGTGLAVPFGGDTAALCTVTGSVAARAALGLCVITAAEGGAAGIGAEVRAVDSVPRPTGKRHPAVLGCTARNRLGATGPSFGKSRGLMRLGDTLSSSTQNCVSCKYRGGTAMTTDNDHKAGMTSEELLARVRSKRAEVDKYVEVNCRRRRFLVNLVITAGAFAALLTAPAAVGGKRFTDWLQQLFNSPAPSWQFLCLFASLSSLATVAAIQIQKSNNYEEHIVRAQGVRAALEVLEVSITSGSLTTRKATSQFLKCLEDCSFMEPIH